MLLVDIYEAADDAPDMALPLYEALAPVCFPSPADDCIDLKLDLNDYLMKKPCAPCFAKFSGVSMTITGKV